MTTRLLSLFGTVALTVFLFARCAHTSAYQKIFPSAVEKGVDFNMSLADFNALKGVSTSDMTDDSFRWVYLEKQDDPKISDIVYYFDKDGDQPLYEMIFIYKDTTVRNADATELLGEPNAGEEWELDLEPYPVNAWKFKSKLVMAALVPLTEWNETGN